MSEPATVTTASPLLVQLDSSQTPVPALCLGSYTPVLADRVSVDKQGSQVVVLGGPAGPVAGATMGTRTTTATNGTVTSAGTDTRDAVLGNYTFTALAGRRYRAVLDGGLLTSSTGNDVVALRIRNGGGSTPTTSSTAVATSYSIPPTAWWLSFSLAGTFVPGAGTQTLSLFVQRAGGTGVDTPSGSRELYAVDLGPA